MVLWWMNNCTHIIPTPINDNNNNKRYESLVHAIIRPPRAQYQMEQLGPSDFTFFGRRYHRDDIELLSSNTMTHNTGADGGDPTKRNNVNGGDTPTCSFLRMQVSVWTRQCNIKEGDNKDDDNNTDDNNDDAAFVAHREEDELRDTKEKTQPARRRRRRTKNTKTMLVYLHGNASARLEVVPSLSFLLGQVGVDGVVGVDFTGSGKSDGEYVSLGHYEQVDLDCLIQHLERVYGDSGGLGSGGMESDLEIILWGYVYYIVLQFFLCYFYLSEVNLLNPDQILGRDGYVTFSCSTVLVASLTTVI